MKILLLEWLDAQSDNGWLDEDEFEAPIDLTLTVGFLIQETSKFYVVAATFDPHTNANNARMVIPKGMVKRKKVLWKKNL